MAINSLQKRGRQIGEIRFGAQVQTQGGKMAPTKLEAFRFTTKSATIAHAVASLFGGEARPATLLNNDKTWEVFTEATEIPVMVPPGDNVVSQYMEMWSRGGCQRRCDSDTELLSQTPCKCPFDNEERQALAQRGQACKPVTRVNVMLPDLPDLGVWLISSNGWNAAEEMGGTAAVLSKAREAGVIIPATLRLEQRQKIKAGQTMKYPVPVLELGASLRQMAQLGTGQDIASALPPPPPNASVAAIGMERTIDLGFWIKSVLDEDQRSVLRPVWKQQFPNFPTTAVPLSREQEARQLVNDFLHELDDEPLLAEIVTRIPESNPQRSGGAVAQDLDPERPFD